MANLSVCPTQSEITVFNAHVVKLFPASDSGMTLIFSAPPPFKSSVTDRAMSVEIILKGWMRGVNFFLADFYRYTRMVWRGNRWGRSIFLGGRPHPHAKEQGPASPKFFCTNTYAKTIWPRATKFGMVTREGEAFLGGQPRHPRPKGAGLQYPKKFWDLQSCAHHTVRESTKFRMVVKRDARKMSTGSITNAHASSVCGS